MMDATTLPPAVPEPLRSPDSHSRLALKNDSIVDVDGLSVGRKLGPVWSFMDSADDFYEGRYNNRVRYVPRGDSWLAKLPMRIVMQAYPSCVVDQVPKGAEVVEIGCAGGLTWFGQRYRMIGMDLSLEALNLAAEDYDTVMQCDATRMPLADESVDAVISSCLFEHLTDNQKIELLAECDRVLKPGGKVVFLYDLWTDNSLIAGYRRADPDRYQRMFLDHDGHLGYRSIDENRAFFRAAGFHITREIFHECTPFQTNSVWKKFSEWQGVRGRVGRIGARLTSGVFHLPMLALLSVVDTSLGRLFPKAHARGMITVATKP